jgi:hypothetical protein
MLKHQLRQLVVLMILVLAPLASVSVSVPSPKIAGLETTKVGTPTTLQALYQTLSAIELCGLVCRYLGNPPLDAISGHV